MGVLKSRFFRIFLLLSLVLSFSLSSAFAGTTVGAFPFAQPPANDTQGFIVVETASGSTYCYWWTTSLYGLDTGDNDNNDAVVVDLNVKARSIDFTFNPKGSYSYFTYNLCYSSASGSSLTILGDGASAGSYKITDTFSSDIVNFVYFGNVGTATRYSTSLGVPKYTFGNDSYILDSLSNISSKLNSVTSKFDITYDLLEDLYYVLDSYPDDADDIIALLTDLDVNTDDLEYWLRSIYYVIDSYPDDVADMLAILRDIRDTDVDILDLLEEWSGTTLDESTKPLPDSGINDFESSSGDLRNESDVSSSLDDVFNDADFGSFSNGFSVIWDLVDSLFATNPVFFTLVILVLTLGLLNLIFNSR